MGNYKRLLNSDVSITESDDGSMSLVLEPYKPRKTKSELEKEIDKDIKSYMQNHPSAGV